LTGPQLLAKLRRRPIAAIEKLVSALDDLKWLPKIVSCYRK
jgi:hypothetical protein